MTRSEAWDRVFMLIQEHPLLGMGPAGYHFYFTASIDGFYQLSHNNYIDIIAQTGFVGFVFYAWMWLAMGWITWRMYRTVPRQGFRYGLAVSLVAAYFVSLATMMLGDWITPFPYTQTLAGIDYTIWHWMMAGLTVALYYESKHYADNQMTSSTITQVRPLLVQPD
jgi:O-antigen ligase